MSDNGTLLPAGVETPAYVYDLDEVRRSHARLRATVPAPHALYYSLKANPHPAIVGALRALGCRAEVCSPGELAVALAAGVPAGDILYTGPGKRDADVAAAIEAGVTWFSVDSPTGLEQADRIAAGAGTVVTCLLRVNDRVPVAGHGLTMTGVASQFGADATWVAAEPARFRPRPHARLAGFHLYLGSNILDEEALYAQFATAVGTARRLAAVLDIEVEVLDLGGGFGAPYARAGVLPEFPGLRERLAACLDDAFDGWRHGRPEVAFESGRYLTATCGALWTRVLDVKSSHDQPVVVLESGINHLGGMSGLRRLPAIVPDLLPDDGAERETVARTIVAGPLCTPLDTWARGVDVPRVTAGDLLRVPNVGAYGLSASLLAFLGHPAPDEVVLDAGRVISVSRLSLVRQRTPLSTTV